ncbi:MAG: hypothetical protein HDR27_10155 [Lachnospiraceae bacterium]|nr:hypothetical protein [Lachnospiraceae bacterium]
MLSVTFYIQNDLVYGALAERSLKAALVSGAVLCVVGLGLTEKCEKNF